MDDLIFAGYEGIYGDYVSKEEQKEFLKGFKHD